ncbi:hypothetical protein Tco_0294452 [Tanacetum coccineum]
MGRGTWYYSLGVFLAIVDAFVRSEFEISSWRGARVDVRTYLLGGAIDGSEANGIIRDPKLELESFTPRRRIGFRMELVQGAMPICEGSCRLTSLERQEVWNDCRSCKVRVGLNGNLWWEASVLLGRKKGAMLRTSMVDFRGNWNTHFREMSFSLRWGLSFEYGCASFEAWVWVVEGLTLERYSTFGKKDKLERSKLFVELMDKRKKHFAKIRAKEI